MAQSSNPPKRQLSRHHSFSRRDKITSERLTVHRCKRGTGCQCIPIPFAKAIPKQWTGRSKETPRFKLVFTNCRQSRERRNNRNAQDASPYCSRLFVHCLSDYSYQQGTSLSGLSDNSKLHCNYRDQ